MSDANPDLQHIATQYRDMLKSELAKVEAFLAMAEQLSKSSEKLGSGLLVSDETEPELELGGQPLNVFRMSK